MYVPGSRSTKNQTYINAVPTSKGKFDKPKETRTTMLRQRLTQEVKTIDMRIEEEKAPNKPLKSPKYLDQDPAAEFHRYANSNYQVFETEPNDLLPED